MQSLSCSVQRQGRYTQTDVNGTRAAEQRGVPDQQLQCSDYLPYESTSKKKNYDVDAEKAAAREATTFLHAILRVSNEFIRKIHFTPKNYDWSCGNGKKKLVTRCFTTSQKFTFVGIAKYIPELLAAAQFRP